MPSSTSIFARALHPPDGEGRARLPLLRDVPGAHPDLRERHRRREEAVRAALRAQCAGHPPARADAAAAAAQELGERSHFVGALRGGGGDGVADESALCISRRHEVLLFYTPTVLISRHWCKWLSQPPPPPPPRFSVPHHALACFFFLFCGVCGACPPQDRFTSDPKAVLVATDVAARGLDIPKVSSYNICRRTLRCPTPAPLPSPPPQSDADELQT